MNMIPHDDLPPALRARLASLKGGVSAIEPPPALEAALIARLFATAQAARRPGPAIAARPAPAPAERWAPWIAWPVSMAAAIGLCSWLVLKHPAIAPEPADSRTASGATQSVEAATPFLALASLDDFPVGMRSEVVAAALPRATLAEFGLPVSPMRAAEPILAEFLVGPDGGVLAVRFVGDAGL